MAKHSHILELARKGAEHTYEELKAEIAALVKHFPHLARGKRGKKASAKADAVPRQRRKISAKGRKAISDAQKKRWAKQRADKKK